MSAAKKRVNLTLSDDLYKTLENLSAKYQKPISTLGLDLIEMALELQEDNYFSKLGEERLKDKSGKKLSHADVWK